jgi:hypothetical protein
VPLEQQQQHQRLQLLGHRLPSLGEYSNRIHKYKNVCRRGNT